MTGNIFCEDCSKLWTAYCPYRTRDENDRNSSDEICDEFKAETKRFVWIDSAKLYYY